jgi:hypothetical protein
MWIILAGFLLVLSSSYFVATRPRVADPSSLFEKPAYSGELYDAGWVPKTDFSYSARFYDVELAPEDNCVKNSWRTGGIIRSYGSGQPKIVVVGSSHAMMHSKLIDSICQKSGISVSYLCIAAQSVFYDARPSLRLPTEQEVKEFYDTRRKFIQEWRPDAIIVIDRWDLTAHSPDEFEKKLRSFLGEFSPLAGRVFFVSQVPVHVRDNQVNLRELVNFRIKNQKTLPQLYPDSRDGLRGQLSKRAESLMTDFKNFQVLRVDSLFYKKDGSILYSSGRDFLYLDNDHLTDAGSELARPIFEQAIKEACSAGKGK